MWLRAFPVLNLLVIAVVVYLKILYGRFHWLLQNIHKEIEIPKDLSLRYISAFERLGTAATILAIIAIGMAWISLKSKAWPRRASAVVLIVAVLSLAVSLLVM